MEDGINEVTITFTNGDTLDVNTVARLVGAKWLTAEIAHPKEDPEEDGYELEWVILNADDVRYIRSDRVASPNSSDTNWRVHYTGDKDPDDILFDAYKGQHQVHPDDDPSAYAGSEENWPPEGGDPRHQDGPTPAHR